jgi:O-antigen/teichoic acid export membrane protein
VSTAAVTTLKVASEQEVPAIAVVDGAAEGRAPGALLMSAGTVGSGLLAYAFNAVAARALGPDAYGPIAVLWAAMFLVAVVLFRPVEQTLSREVAEATAHGRDVRPLLRAVAALAAGTVLAAVLACVAAWGPITDGLFDGKSMLTAMLVVGIAGYGASYFVRGVIGGRRWYAGYGIGLLADGGVRLALVLPLFAVASTSLAAAALAAAAFAGGVAPLLAREGRTALRQGPATAPAEPVSVGRLARFAGPVGLVAAGDQILLSGGPVLVMLHGGPGASKAAGVVFAATMLVRAPAYLFQGISAALLPNLTTMLANRDEQGFRRAVLRTVAALAAFSGTMAIGAFAVGPAVMHVLYGSGFDATRGDLAFLSLGAGGYLVAATLSQAALARDEAVGAAAIWAASAAIFVALELALSGDALMRVAVAFCVATLCNATAFWALSFVRRTGARTAPNLRLAAADADQ